jgi:nitrilase
MMIDPWGLVLDSLESGPGFVSMDLDKNVLQEIRAKLPALQHRKL